MFSGKKNRFIKKYVAIIIIAFLFFLMQFSNMKGQVNSDFIFEAHILEGSTEGKLANSTRPVHPSYKNIKSWVSSVGAGVAINDINGDGLSDDICLVDTRYNTVTIQSSNNKYEKFELELNDPESLTVAPMGCVPADINEDGFLDILVYYWGRPPVAFLQKNIDKPLSKESFELQELVDTNEEWFTNALTVADIDGDGHLDIIVGNYFLENSNVLNPLAKNKVFMQDTMSRAYNSGKNRILLWNGKNDNDFNVEYKDHSNEIPDEFLFGWTLAIGVADLNKDLLPEIYFANDFGPDRLLMNHSTPGKLHFELLTGYNDWKKPKSEILGKDSFKGMGVEFVDLNKDGWLDILVSNIASEYALLETHFAFINTGDWEIAKKGKAPFENRSVELGINKSSWAWDIKAADFNNNGEEEIVQATGFVKGDKRKWNELQELATINDELLKMTYSWPQFTEGTDLSGNADNAFFVKSNRNKFINIPETFVKGQKSVARGVAIADVNGDGKLDFAIANQWDDSYLYINQTQTTSPFIGLDIVFPIDKKTEKLIVTEGKPLNEKKRYAIGANIEVYLPNGKILTKQVDGGNGHSGKRSYEIHFGLGEINIEKFPAKIAWRDENGHTHEEFIQLSTGWQTIWLPKGDE